MEEAVNAARDVDACLLVLGTDGFWESEGSDQPHMRLPGRQNELVARVVRAARGPVIVVLNVGSPKELPWIDDVSAVALVHYGGEELARGAVDVLLGRVCAGGRLPTTWPRRQSEAAAEFKPYEVNIKYTEGIYVGHRHFSAEFAERRPLFPFGHGLSYTSFEHSNLTCRVAFGIGKPSGPSAEVRAEVKNTGARSGSEVVQLYAHPPGQPRALVAFKRTRVLTPGEKEVVTFNLGMRALGGFWDSVQKRWEMPAKAGESMEVVLELGASSSDIRAKLTCEVR